uniref:CDKN1A interacting zinc finger protein 1 n=1 Tax=Anolis carolinensis TaxID=28377 RepID=H9GC61_ANOCA|nr:PREDICTED: cip1-interacting zinc finger protein isoform X1 [Anolis carolinensis]|eukprot:XP_008121050.1 PREDICTED: cip1-interacting zinc finger protein isoform X1 [Anolis carolinensis]
MFPQQQQQQLQQHLLQLQQLLQPPPPPPSRGVTPSPQQQMLNMRATGQASLLSANPMLQRALLIQQMQGSLRGFNMAAAPVLQQFFPQATRHSLLGPPPVGVSLKPTRLAFPSLPFQWQNRTFRKDFPRNPERKREADSSSSSTHGQGADEAGPHPDVSDHKTDPKQPLDQSCPQSSEILAESSPDGEPAGKRLKSNGEELLVEETACLLQAEDPNTESHLEEGDNVKAALAGDALEEKNFVEELKTSEVVSSSGSLKVTIQQSSESRAISTTALKPTHWTSEMGTAETSPESAVKFYCYICKTDCSNQQNFQAHMAGVQHQQRLQDIQQSNVCFVSLLPVMKEQNPLIKTDGDSQQRWCNTCQAHFIGDLIKHRRTQEHKLAKRSLRPLCTVCSRHFKTPRKFVEHMKSVEHKQKAKEVRLGEKEHSGPEDSEELITVDAIGCFEEDDDDEEEEEGEETGVGEELENEELLPKEIGLKEMLPEDICGNERYCPNTVYGRDFLVPVAGFLCKLCHKFYHHDSAGRFSHCKSLMHFENLQRYKAMRLQAASLLVKDASHNRQSAAVAKTEAASPIKEATIQAETCVASRAEPGFANISPGRDGEDTHGITPTVEVADDGRISLAGAVSTKADASGQCGLQTEPCGDASPKADEADAGNDDDDDDCLEDQDQGNESELSFPDDEDEDSDSGIRRSARRQAR